MTLHKFEKHKVLLLSIGEKLFVFLLAAIVIGTVIGLWKALQITIANKYFQYDMWRIAGLVLQQQWMSSLQVTLKISIFLLVFALGMKVLWNLLIGHGIEIKDKSRITAIIISSFSFAFGLLLLYHHRTAGSPYSQFNLLTLTGVLSISSFVGWFYHQFSNRRKSALRSFTSIGLFSLLMFGVLNVGFYLDQHRTSSSKLNVVWIVIDSLRADHLGCYGYQKTTSPNLDRIASRSVLFKNAFSQESYTQASAASYFTSTYPFVNRVLYTYPTIDTLDPKFVTVPEVLRNEGYSTAAIAHNPQLVSLKSGFQLFHMRSRASKKRRLASMDNYETASVIFDKTKEFLESRNSAPLFLYLHYMDVHVPYAAPDPYNKMFLPAEFHSNVARLMRRSFDYGKGEKQLFADLYDGGISYTDASIQQLLELLKEHGINWDNTIFIFSADHGEDFYDPHPDDPGGVQHHRTLYQELIHVPLIIAAPGLAAKNIENRVQLIDILPTVLDLTGIPWKKFKDFQGQSLVSLMKGGSNFQNVPILSGGNRERRSLIAGDWKYYKFELQCKQSLSRCFSRSTKNMPDLQYGEQLFNIKADPKETVDLVDIEPQKAGAMKKVCSELLKSQHAASTIEINIDQETQEQLKALGYTN